MHIADVNTLDELDLTGKNILMRVDFNVPLQDGYITDNTRVLAALPSITHVLQKAEKLVLASHLGRPQGATDEQLSLEPVAQHLSQLLQENVSILRDYRRSNVFSLAKQMHEARLIVLENLRFYPEEKQNNEGFAKCLAKGFDVFINDAFATMHRDHASVSAVAEHFSFAQRGVGFLVQKELQALGQLLNNAPPPFLLVIGGAKINDKIATLFNLLKHCHQVIIGGAMAYAFLRHQGYSVGKSLVDEQTHLVEAIFTAASERSVEILLPIDHCAANIHAADASPVYVDTPSLPEELLGLDIGKQTIKLYCQAINNANTILWNAPLGKFEWDNFAAGTQEIAAAISKNKGLTVVGGGDTVAAIKHFGFTDFSHVSTGGGASLQYLAGERMHGLRALAKGIG